MYNGVGLQTARGSGGSGYVQKNLSANNNVKKMQNRQDFLRELQQMRKNNLPPARKANPQIVQHQRKRQILIHTMKLKQKLKKQGLTDKQIDLRVKKAESILKQKYEKGDLQTTAKQTHVLTQAKQKQYMKLSKAFGLATNNKVGSSFDFQGIKQQKLKKMQEKRLKSEIFKCPHQQCGKSYDMQQLLDRHLKYKHPQIYKIIQQERQKQQQQIRLKKLALKAEQQNQRKTQKQQKYKKIQQERQKSEEMFQKYRRQNRKKRQEQKQKQKQKQRQRSKHQKQRARQRSRDRKNQRTRKRSQQKYHNKKKQYDNEKKRRNSRSRSNNSQSNKDSIDNRNKNKKINEKNKKRRSNSYSSDQSHSKSSSQKSVQRKRQRIQSQSRSRSPSHSSFSSSSISNSR